MPVAIMKSLTELRCIRRIIYNIKYLRFGHCLEYPEPITHGHPSQIQIQGGEYTNLLVWN